MPKPAFRGAPGTRARAVQLQLQLQLQLLQLLFQLLFQLQWLPPASRRVHVPGVQATREPRARRGAAKPGEAADRPCHLACAARAEVAQGLRGHLRPPAHASRSAATPARQRGQPGAQIVGNGGIELILPMLLAACHTRARRKAREVPRLAVCAMTLEAWRPSTISIGFHGGGGRSGCLRERALLTALRCKSKIKVIHQAVLL